MGKLYFKYGCMSSSKTAAALMCKFNYEQNGFSVLLLQPACDTRDEENGEYVVKSRIGISSKSTRFSDKQNLTKMINAKKPDVIIVDECQFLSNKQVEELKIISENKDVLCYGLLTNFRSKLFDGSKRLVELADSLQELKTVCRCGRKATMNVRLENGKVVTRGNEIEIEGKNKDITYEVMCYWCKMKKIKESKVK